MNLASVCFTQLWLKKKQSTNLTVHSSIHQLLHYLSSQYRKAKRGETLKNNQPGAASTRQ